MDLSSCLSSASGPKSNNITQFYKDRNVTPESWRDYPTTHNNVTIHLQFENNSGAQVTVHTYDEIMETIYGKNKDGRESILGIRSSWQFND